MFPLSLSRPLKSASGTSLLVPSAAESTTPVATLMFTVHVTVPSFREAPDRMNLRTSSINWAGAVGVSLWALHCKTGFPNWAQSCCLQSRWTDSFPSSCWHHASQPVCPRSPLSPCKGEDVPHHGLATVFLFQSPQQRRSLPGSLISFPRM